MMHIQRGILKNSFELLKKYIFGNRILSRKTTILILKYTDVIQMLKFRNIYSIIRK